MKKVLFLSLLCSFLTLALSAQSLPVKKKAKKKAKTTVVAQAKPQSLFIGSAIPNGSISLTSVGGVISTRSVINTILPNQRILELDLDSLQVNTPIRQLIKGDSTTTIVEYTINNMPGIRTDSISEARYFMTMTVREISKKKYAAFKAEEMRKKDLEIEEMDKMRQKRLKERDELRKRE